MNDIHYRRLDIVQPTNLALQMIRYRDQPIGRVNCFSLECGDSF
jgi:hypothetical protein